VAAFLRDRANEYRRQSICGPGTSITVEVPEIPCASQRNDQLQLRTQDQKGLSAYSVAQVAHLAR